MPALFEVRFKSGYPGVGPRTLPVHRSQIYNMPSIVTHSTMVNSYFLGPLSQSKQKTLPLSLKSATGFYSLPTVSVCPAYHGAERQGQ